MKWDFLQVGTVSVLLYSCTTRILMKHLEKKLNGNYTRMLHAVLNKSWKQHPTKQQLYDHLPPISLTIQGRWARHAEHCWRSMEKLISDVLPWTPTHGHTCVGQIVKAYIHFINVDTEYCLKELPRVIGTDDKKEPKESVLSECLISIQTVWFLKLKTGRLH